MIITLRHYQHADNADIELLLMHKIPRAFTKMQWLHNVLTNPILAYCVHLRHELSRAADGHQSVSTGQCRTSAKITMHSSDFVQPFRSFHNTRNTHTFVRRN